MKNKIFTYIIIFLCLTGIAKAMEHSIANNETPTETPKNRDETSFLNATLNLYEGYGSSDYKPKWIELADAHTKNKFLDLRENPRHREKHYEDYADSTSHCIRWNSDNSFAIEHDSFIWVYVPLKKTEELLEHGTTCIQTLNATSLNLRPLQHIVLHYLLPKASVTLLKTAPRERGYPTKVKSFTINEKEHEVTVVLENNEIIRWNLATFTHSIEPLPNTLDSSNTITIKDSEKYKMCTLNNGNKYRVTHNYSKDHMDLEIYTPHCIISMQPECESVRHWLWGLQKEIRFYKLLVIHNQQGLIALIMNRIQNPPNPKRAPKQLPPESILDWIKKFPCRN